MREPNEYQINRIPGSTLIPLGELPRRYQELDPEQEIVAHCKMGGRSAKAVDFLKSVGFKKVKNLRGGILEWIDKVDPTPAQVLRSPTILDGIRREPRKIRLLESDFAETLQES